MITDVMYYLGKNYAEYAELVCRRILANAPAFIEKEKTSRTIDFAIENMHLNLSIAS